MQWATDTTQSWLCETTFHRAKLRGYSFLQKYQIDSTELLIRSFLRPLESQVGGFSTEKLPILCLTLQPSSSDSDHHHFVLKPLHTDHRGIREVAFYEDAVKNAQFNCLSKFLPMYYGILTLPDNSSTNEVSSRNYIILSHVTQSFRNPCVMDLKMGRQSYEPGASELKIRQEQNKYPQQEIFGFRLVGMRVYTPIHSLRNDDDDDEANAPSCYTRYDKAYGRSLHQSDQLLNALQTFFTAVRNETKDQVTEYKLWWNVLAIRTVLKELQKIQKWFHDNISLAFYSSSLLIVIEGDTEVLKGMQSSSSDEEDRHGTIATVKMIDFGHIQHCEGGDGGYMYGLQVLSNLLHSLLERSDTGAQDK